VGAKRLTDEAYTVSGTLSPDVTGNYIRVPEYNGKPSYMLAAGGWYIWWDNVDSWKISTVQGTEGTNFWTRTSVDIVGVYSPTLPATGDATVALTV